MTRIPAATRILSLWMGLPLLFSFAGCKNPGPAAPPNIVYILADDLGPGDISACNPNAGWKTGQIDRIADEGMMFTDAHSGSAVCTPTRYGILTGRYSWRTPLKKGVLWSYSPPLIRKEETTVAEILRSRGYTTACIGKWHLGLDWKYHEGTSDSVDFSRRITGGPLEHGFDRFFGITASLDIPPYVYIEGDRATTVPTRYTVDTSQMGWWRRGLTGNDFTHEEVLPELTREAVDFIDSHASAGNESPLFLYMALPAPHTPILPTGEFRGISGTNAYGDFVLQVDHSVGQILNALERNGLADNTLVIFTSDNGCSPYAGFEELAQFGHDPCMGYRGSKADIFEGGHRIPFLVRWPRTIEPGRISEQVICLTDLAATVAEITRFQLRPSEAVDSYSLLPAFLNRQEEPLREATVHHSVNGSFAIRQGPWKLILCPGSGGWSDPRPGSEEAKALPPLQLYHMTEDPRETNNLVSRNPGKVDQLTGLLRKYIEEGRSTPGPVQEVLWSEDWPGLEWMVAETE